MTITSYLQSLFEDHVIVDDREPILTIPINKVDHPILSTIFLGADNDDTTTQQQQQQDDVFILGLYAPNSEGWKQMAIFVVIQSIIQMIFGIVIYQYIVKQRKTIQSYMLGWGIIVPLSIYIPFELLDLLNIRNKTITLSSTTIMTVICFRCIEAMYGTTAQKDVIESSLSNYCTYYSSVAPFIWDSKTKKRKHITFQQLILNFIEILLYFIAVSLVVSILKPHNYKLFQDDPVPLTTLTVSMDLLSMKHLVNSYCYAILLYLTLKTGFDITAFGEQIKGLYATDTIFDSPFLLSKTPTEFWTKRWNLMIQRFLKVTVERPCFCCT